MKILIVDNHIDRDSWGAQSLCRLARLSPQATIVVRRAPQDDLPKNLEPFDRIIVSGSKTSALEDAPWIEHLLDFIREAVSLEKPFLGVCYGHQMLVRALGGKDLLRRSEKAEFGWTQIRVTESSSLLKDVPSSFYSFSAHFEEAFRLPEEMRRLAASEACDIQACQLGSRPIFGLQFHPEKTLEEAKAILAEKKKKGIPPILLNPNRSEELYNLKIGETVFRNFLGELPTPKQT